MTVAWAAGLASGSVSVEATGKEATLYRIEENGSVSATSIAPVGSAYELGLPAATNRNNGGGGPFVGGRTTVLVERVATPPTVTQSSRVFAREGRAPGPFGPESPRYH